jgi:hypothetical protein
MKMASLLVGDDSFSHPRFSFVVVVVIFFFFFFKVL